MITLGVIILKAGLYTIILKNHWMNPSHSSIQLQLMALANLGILYLP